MSHVLVGHDSEFFAFTIGGDGYFHTTLEAENSWLLGQLAAGLVSPTELEQRGRSVATPMGSKER
ncbi:MAG: hypothetical protein Q8L37_04620 [Candidatus Gottesmanbacteria bacterium]|nr:hypothetical protein [Candidatus Gottesmanbacteria bacterium]